MAADASSDQLAPKAERIGPGFVVLIVGPSGAGKDALLQGLRQHPDCNPRLHFAERIVSRESHIAEVHATDNEQAMAAAAARGDYALSWRAHGLTYAIPAAIDRHVLAGGLVVFNASRTVVDQTRRRYANTRVVLIDVPKAVRAARIRARGRETADELETRLARSVDFDPSCADVIVDNSGELASGVAALAAALQSFAGQSIAD
ncbi:MAG: phosphonate metabolism protein/1,5-bisphosphokinase (PRPP-forming) PhnN [Alphaproteobacteria bacterium]|nr:phosphonate metabolism protein/1,5-bisphosphokinase (PRPP-forming) PhnN [Alphaproteobacteria bacterium]